MADLAIPKQQFLEGISPDITVKKKWIQVQIQERVSRINNTKQLIEDLVRGQKVNLEAKVIMFEKEKVALERQLADLDIEEAEVVT